MTAVEPPLFTAIEQKLIKLGLDPAAYQGESDACAVKLFRSLRKRGATAEQVIRSFVESSWADKELVAARGYIVNFGCFKGRTVGEVPSDYLSWALKTCDNMSFNLRRAMLIVLRESNKN